MSNTILMNDGMRHPANPSLHEDKFLHLFYYTVWMDDVDKVNKIYNQSFDSLEDAVCSVANLEWFMDELRFMDYESSHGECPMNVVWNMHNNIPGFILESAKAI